MIDYTKNNYGWARIKFYIQDFFKKNKLIIILLIFVILISLLTGIFTSIKLYNADNDIDLEDFSMYAMIDGGVYSFKYFILRFVSCLIMAGLLFVCSFNLFLNILGICLIVYRSFLVTLNCTFIIIKMGLGGILSSILIVLPIQILLIALLSLMFIIYINMSKDKKLCGSYDNNYKKLLLILLISMLLLDIVEITLLLIFKPTTILII